MSEDFTKMARYTLSNPKSDIGGHSFPNKSFGNHPFSRPSPSVCHSMDGVEHRVGRVGWNQGNRLPVKVSHQSFKSPTGTCSSVSAVDCRRSCTARRGKAVAELPSPCSQSPEQSEEPKESNQKMFLARGFS